MRELDERKLQIAQLEETMNSKGWGVICQLLEVNMTAARSRLLMAPMNSMDAIIDHISLKGELAAMPTMKALAQSRLTELRQELEYLKQMEQFDERAAGNDSSNEQPGADGYRDPSFSAP